MNQSVSSQRSWPTIASRKSLQERAISGLQASWNTGARLELWFRAFERIRREAETVQAEGDVFQAYMLYLRCVELVVTYMPTHPEARDPVHRRHLIALNGIVEGMIRTLTGLKVQVDDLYAAEQARVHEERVVRNQQIQISAARKKALTAVDQKREERPAETPKDGRDDLMYRLSALREAHQLGGPASATATTPAQTLPASRSSASNSLQTKTHAAPPAQASAQVIKPDVAAVSQYKFAPAATLENGTELRTMFVPATLRETFLRMAADNTQRNLETCGILSGKPKANAYFVTHLIIPAQESTSDTCHTTDETLLFTFQDAHDLFTLGWIHTHPTQTCFLSSVDVHTQMSYQVMLPEAVAIVLSPSKTPDWGAFRLTDPPGMQAVKGCRQSGLFHPHEETNIYTDALYERGFSTGHLREIGMTFSVEDQRLQHAQ